MAIDDPYMSRLLEAIRPAFEDAVDDVTQMTELVPGGARGRLRGRRASGRAVTLQFDRKGHPTRTLTAVCFSLDGGRIAWHGRMTVPAHYRTTRPPVALVDAIVDWLSKLDT